VSISDDEVDRLVHYYCVASTARYGPYRAAGPADEMPRGDVLIQGRMYRYRLVDEYGRPVDLQVYVGLGGLGGALWEQEIRLLLRLGGSGLASLPEILEGGYEDAESTARAGVRSQGVALVTTRGSDYSLADAGAAEAIRANPVLALSQFQRLAEALAELHSLGAQHRNLVPAAVLADLSGAAPRLWIARFEMSTLISNLLRRTVDTEVSLDELRMLFLGVQRMGEVPPGTPSSIRALSCQPFERLEFLYPSDAGTAPLLEGPTSDVFSLAAVVWDWFCDPVAITAEPLPDEPVERHAELHRRMIAALGPDSSVPRRLAELLIQMLARDPRNRPTTAEVEQRISEDLNAIRHALADDNGGVPYLVVDNPKESAVVLRSWKLITHGAESDRGRDEIAAFMADDLKHARLLRSPLGAGPFVHGGDPEDKRNSRYVLLGTHAAWFCQKYRVKSWGGQLGPPLDEALIIKYAANREHPGTRRALDDLIDSVPHIPIPAVEVTSVDVAESVMRAALHGRPSWKPLLDSLSEASSDVVEDQEYGDALDWLLRYQGAELQARTYAFEVQGEAGSQATLQWARDREEQQLNSDVLLRKFADSDWLRLSFGTFFQRLEGDEGESQVEIGIDGPGGRPEFPRPQSVWTIVRDRVGEDRVTLQRSGESRPLPKNGWIRPLSDTGTRTALYRQTAARWDLMRARALLSQLREPRSVRTLPHRWKRAGRTLQGQDGAAIVRDMLTYRPFYAIQGPPGTGKTTVVAEAVAEYLREERAARVLISAQSGFALDNLAQRVLTRLGEMTADGKPSDQMDVAALRVTSRSGTQPDLQIQPWTRDELTERVVEATRRKVDAAIASVRNDRLAAALSRWRDLLTAEDGENVRPELSDRLARAVNLVFATCATATAETVTPDGARSRFDWVVVEEAAKAWPTELAMPLARGSMWTLIGDHKQLGAHRREDFERFLADCEGDVAPELANLAENRQVYLDAFDTFRGLFKGLEADAATQDEKDRLPLRRMTTQYRMRRPIAEVVSRVFYPATGQPLADGLPPGRLRTDVEIPALPLKSPAALAGQAVVWLDTSRVPDCSDDEPRWWNPGEVRLTARLVERISPRPVPHRNGYSGEPLAVLTPYRQQARQLAGYDVLHDHVSTIHAFQGREADIVIVSLVRDQRHGPPGVPWSSLGHLTQQNLINVMMSRARKLLVIIGNFAHFARVDEDYQGSDELVDPPFWGRLCTAVQLYGTVLPAREVVDE
jgi:KaiC/GvpD/RAD55 family RecA-like ATPase